MSEPIVFISKFEVKEGKLEALREFFRTGVPELERDKPGTVAFLPFLSEDGSELAIVHVFPDADAFDRHVVGAEERSEAAYEFIEPVGLELFGSPSGPVRQMLSQGATSFLPVFVQGFLRLTT